MNRANLLIAAGIAVFYVYALLLLPVLLLPQSLWWGLTLLPFVWLPVTHWGLIHEAIHKHFNSDAEANDRGGRFLSVLMGPSFHVLRFGHLMHHKLNRDWQSELVPERTASNTLGYYATLLGGLYVSEIGSAIAMTLLSRRAFVTLAARDGLMQPDVLQAGVRFFYERGHVAKVRTDTLLALAIHAGAFMLYGAAWPVLLLALVTRAAVVSFMDNIYHYGTAADDAGKDLALPGFAARLLLNSNYHDTHHRNPDVPWLALPQTHAAQCKAFDGGFLRHGLMQFGGPITV